VLTDGETEDRPGRRELETVTEGLGRLVSHGRPLDNAMRIG
jgi:hypothetical protein